MSEPEQKPASSVPARGYSWPPFEPGNDAAVTHGAYATKVVLQPRARELAGAIAALVPGWQPEFAPAVARLAIVEARIEKAEAAFDAADDAFDAKWEQLRKDLRLWIALALRFYGELGLTPAARARIRKDAGVAAAASVHAQRELADYVERAYGDVVEGESTERSPS